MTPFGARIRALRQARGVTLAKMAADLGISAAYLSAMEHGRRPPPRPNLVRQILGYFNIIWDDADALQLMAARYRPKVTLDAGGLSVEATELVTLLAERLSLLDGGRIGRLRAILDEINPPPASRRGNRPSVVGPRRRLNPP